MAINIDIPATAQSFYKKDEETSLQKKLNGIKLDFGTSIKKMWMLSKIPMEVITSMIFIESAGNKNAYNAGSGATGLMQIAPSSATDTVVMENKRGRLTDGEKALLLKKLGEERYKKLIGYKQLGQPQVITKSDLLDPEFNILIGTIYLGLLIDEHTENGKIRMDKVIARYNRGYFAANKGKDWVRQGVNEVLASQPKETKSYILKMLGKYGTLDIIA